MIVVLVTWEAEETAENSVFTGAAYASRGARQFVVHEAAEMI